MHIKSKLFNFLIVAVLLLLLNVITVLMGDDQSRLTVINKTEYYIHIVIDGNVFPYVGPNVSITQTSSPTSTMRAEVFYSPGQGKTSQIIDSTFSLPYTPASTRTYGDSYSCDCQDETFSCSESSSGVVNVPAQGGSAQWEITNDTFSN